VGDPSVEGVSVLILIVVIIDFDVLVVCYFIEYLKTFIPADRLRERVPRFCPSLRYLESPSDLDLNTVDVAGGPPHG
jgi:hypothetical protein